MGGCQYVFSRFTLLLALNNVDSSFFFRGKEAASSPEQVEANRVINRELLDDRKRLESEVKLLILGSLWIIVFIFILSHFQIKALESLGSQPSSSR
jgi:hypothetical protein